MKPRPGVCDVCGCVVVREPHLPENGYLNGHRYVGGRLKSVRCSAHPEDDTASLAARDVRGGGQPPSWENPRGRYGDQ